MQRTACFLCHTTAYERELYPSNIHQNDLTEALFSARRSPDRLHGRIVRCAQCGLVYTNPLPDPNQVAALYRRSRFTYAQEETFIARTYERYLRLLMPMLERQKRPLSYMDIGCGNGFMLRIARKIGFEDTWGVEPGEHAIAQANLDVRDRLVRGMFSQELLAGRHFDALTCFQTLDHVPNPAEFVNVCFQALKPGGAVLFINHNIASFPARILGERAPMIDIAHTFLHTPETMSLLFARAGFTSGRVFPVRNDYPLQYWLHLLPLPFHLKKMLVSLLQTTHLGTCIVPLYAGNLGLIAQRPM